MDAYRKMHKFTNVISYFSLKSWTFHDKNTRALVSRLSKLDQSLFCFDIAKLNWDDYFQKHVLGVRHFILNDPLETVPEGKKHAQKSVLLQFIFINI